MEENLQPDSWESFVFMIAIALVTAFVFPRCTHAIMRTWAVMAFSLVTLVTNLAGYFVYTKDESQLLMALAWLLVVIAAFVRYRSIQTGDL